MPFGDRLSANELAARTAQPVSWLELFYDLVFVGALTFITSQFSPRLSAAQTIWVFAVIVGVMAMWLLVVLAFSRFPADPDAVAKPWVEWRVSRFIIVCIQMVTFILAMLAIVPTGSMSGPAVAMVFLAVSLAATGGMFFVGKGTVRHGDKRARLVGSLALIAAVFALVRAPHVSASFPWEILVIECLLIAGIVTIVEDKSSIFPVSHLCERFGVLNLIAMGSVFTTVSLGLTRNTQDNRILFFLTFLFPIAVFAMYFGISAPIGEQKPRIRLWIPVEIALAIAVLGTGNAIAKRALAQDLAGLEQSRFVVGGGLTAILVLFGAMCIAGKRVQSVVTVTYFLAAIALGVATLTTYHFHLRPSLTVEAQCVYFAAIALVVSVVGAIWPASKTEAELMLEPVGADDA